MNGTFESAVISQCIMYELVNQDKKSGGAPLQEVIANVCYNHSVLKQCGKKAQAMPEFANDPYVREYLLVNFFITVCHICVSLRFKT